LVAGHKRRKIKMEKNNFTKMLIKEIKKTDKYKRSKAGRIKSIQIMHIETKALRYNPYSEYSEFDINVNGKVTLQMKIYTNGLFEIY
jgi:hypothetical protein